MTLPGDAPTPDTTSSPAAATPQPSVQAKSVSASWTWVPIRSLGPRHRERIAAHLMALGAHDRYLRFGYPATDAQMSKYVDMLDFEHDEVFGIFSRKLELIAMAHLAHATAKPGATAPAMSEFGVSVLTNARGRGFGRRLFEHAMLHARNRGVQTLFIHALSENVAMLKIARNAGATVERDGSETEAFLKLPPDTLASHVGEMVEQQAAEFDYRLKRHARQVNGMFGALADAKTSLVKTSRIADE
ncbi:GNAT family N-acetyltransferase [soil metagenome]